MNAVTPLLAVAFLHGMAAIGFMMRADAPMAVVMSAFTVADLAFAYIGYTR